MRIFKWGPGVISSSIVILALWAFWLEPSALHNATYRLPILNWPVACAGFKTALLADLHVGSPFNGLAKLDRIVQLTNAANPDLPRVVTLTLAGHTHGGQVNLPLAGRLVVPSRYGQRYAIGHIVERQRHLFVTPGLGTSILPVRFRVPPEISLLELIPAPEA